MDKLNCTDGIAQLHAYARTLPRTEHDDDIYHRLVTLAEHAIIGLSGMDDLTDDTLAATNLWLFGAFTAARPERKQ